MPHDSPEAISPGSSRLQRVLREPLLQFLVLGLLLFAFAHVASQWRAAHERRIVIDAPLVAWQRNLYHAQFGTWPDAETLVALLKNHVRDEVLYREAVRLGLGADDEVIRQRLIQKMEFVLSDAVQPPEPDDATLQTFLAQHAEKYADPGRVSFDLLYFADQPDAATARLRAEAVLRQVAAGAKHVRSDPFALGESWSEQSAAELKRSFGDSPMANEPLHASLDTWAGPFRSGYGWHLIRVTARGESVMPSLASVREQLRSDWQADFRERDRDARIAALIAQHQVVRLDQQAAQ